MRLMLGGHRANMINPHGGVELLGPRRLHGQTAWGCSSLLTKIQTDEKITNQLTEVKSNVVFTGRNTVLPCTVLHTSPHRSPPSSPSPPHRPGSCLSADHTPAVHQQPQRRHDKLLLTRKASKNTNIHSHFIIYIHAADHEVHGRSSFWRRSSHPGWVWSDLTAPQRCWWLVAAGNPNFILSYVLFFPLGCIHTNIKAFVLVDNLHGRYQSNFTP